MSWRDFLRTYVPLLVAGIFIVGFLFDGQGWAYLSSSPISLIPYLSGIAVVFALVSFGVGSLVWSVLYVVKSSRPSYLSSVKNTLLLLLGLSLLGTFSQFGFLADEKESRTDKDQAPTETKTEERGEVLRGEDGEPITLDDFRVSGRTITTWRETAIWKTTNKEEVVVWVESGKELNLKERSAELFEVNYEGKSGYVDKGNIKPEDR